MNLRTITCWAAYDPKRREIVSLKKYRKLLDNGTFPGCVMVKLKGHYAPHDMASTYNPKGKP